jgi:hypothetical protein
MKARFLLIAEIDVSAKQVKAEGLEGAAQRALDSFRESTLPGQRGVLLYRAQGGDSGLTGAGRAGVVKEQ